MSEMKEKITFDRLENKVVTEYVQDVEPILEQNKFIRNCENETGRFKSGNSGLVHAVSISEVDVLRLKHMGYDLMSPDQDERRRALMYIQQNEKQWLVTNGKPFQRKRQVWA